MTLLGADLRLRLRGKDPAALRTVSRFLERHGIAGACSRLGLSRTTIYRLGKDWDELACALERYAMDPSKRGTIGGLASAASGRGGRRKR